MNDHSCIDWDDRKQVLRLIRKDGNCLAHADKFNGDKAMVLMAVNNVGLALRYASEELRNDPEIVRAAITRNGYALEFASDAIKADKMMVMLAVQENGWALAFAEESMRTLDRELQGIANQTKQRHLQQAKSQMSSQTPY